MVVWVFVRGHEPHRARRPRPLIVAGPEKVVSVSSQLPAKKASQSIASPFPLFNRARYRARARPLIAERRLKIDNEHDGKATPLG
jgi:hypothetical protein